MRNLTATICLTIAVLLGSAGLFSAPANAESKYVPLTDEQIDRVFSGIERVSIPDAINASFYSGSWLIEFSEGGEWEGNIRQRILAWGEWSSKNNKLCLIEKGTSGGTHGSSFYKVPSECFEVLRDTQSDEIVGNFPKLNKKNYVLLRYYPKTLLPFFSVM